MKKQLGRPKQSEEAKAIIYLSLNESIVTKLKTYCILNNVSITSVVTKLINTL